MAELFLSYRRGDSEATAGRLADHLKDAFGPSTVFQDVYSMPPGQDFRSTIEEAVKDSEVVLVLIGRSWLTTDLEGRRRIDDYDDFVRQEVELALKNGKLVIPVLVDGATMPLADALPESIRDLAYRHALPVRPGGDFESDTRRLIVALEENTGVLRGVSFSPHHQSAAMPLHILIVAIFGLLALTSIGGGIYAIAVRSTAQTTLTILGMELRTEHVGVALVGIGFIVAFLTIRSVLRSQHDLAKLPLDR